MKSSKGAQAGPTGPFFGWLLWFAREKQTRMFPRGQGEININKRRDGSLTAAAFRFPYSPPFTAGCRLGNGLRINSGIDKRSGTFYTPKGVTSTASNHR
jgi:hypothetical protein